MGVPLNIDWQQILLHMFNLIILTGGLYFLLYQPVTAFMKKRQEYYAGLEADAQAKLQEAEQKVREADETLSGMQAEAEQLRADAMKQADAEAAAVLQAQTQKSRKFLLPQRRRPRGKRTPCCVRPTSRSVRWSPTRSTSWSPTRTIRMRIFCTQSSGEHNA